MAPSLEAEDLDEGWVEWEHSPSCFCGNEHQMVVKEHQPLDVLDDELDGSVHPLPGVEPPSSLHPGTPPLEGR